MSINTYINNDIKIILKTAGEKASKDSEILVSKKEVAIEKSYATCLEKGGSSNEKVYLIGTDLRIRRRVC